jgi:hypothetical protein
VTKNALTNLVLPDPARQLVDWATEWPGAIHRIFMKNAATHPDRPCVFETGNFTLQLVLVCLLLVVTFYLFRLLEESIVFCLHPFFHTS